MLGAVAVGLIALVAAAPDDNGKTAKKPDYAEMSKMIQKLAADKMPRMIEDTSGWGQTVPIPEKLRAPGLRKTVRVGNRMELPHGLWRKVKVWMKDPAKDLRINVRDVQRLDPKTIRVTVDSQATFGTAVQAQLWQKGLALPGFAGKAGATIGVLLDCDVAMEFVTNKFPPEVKIVPKITKLKTDLRDFNLQEISTLRLGTILQGERAKEFGNKYKDILKDLMHSAEPMIKDYANDAIAQSLKEGKGTFGAAAVFKMLGAAAPKETKKAAPAAPAPGKNQE
jgi:hypothetical protein